LSIDILKNLEEEEITITKAILIDKETGEIINSLDTGDRIVKKKSKEYLEDTVEWGKGLSFVKLFDNYFPRVALQLSGGAVALMSILATYIKYGSSLLCNKRNDYPLNNHDIEEITGLSNKTVSKLMSELVDNKVLARVHTGKSWKYFANPYIYCRGSRINKTLEDMFRDYPDRYK